MDLLTQVESRVAKKLQAVEAWAAELASDPKGVAPDELERRCRDLGLAVAHEVLDLLWAHYGTGDQGPAVQCPCGGTRRRRGLRPRTLRDLMNRPLTVRRAYYFCAACGQGWLPLDEVSFAKMVMGLRPTLHHEIRLSSPLRRRPDTSMVCGTSSPSQN